MTTIHTKRRDRHGHEQRLRLRVWVGVARKKWVSEEKVLETIADVARAAISLHALTRHQYQRRIMTSPTPAVRLKRYFHASPTRRHHERAPSNASTMTMSVAMREKRT